MHVLGYIALVMGAADIGFAIVRTMQRQWEKAMMEEVIAVLWIILGVICFK